MQLPGVSELHSSWSRLSSRRTMNRVERHDDFVRCSQLSEPAAASEALLRQTCSSRCRPGPPRFRRHHTDHRGQQRATKALAAGRCGLIRQRDGWSGCQRPCEARRKRFYNGDLPPREGCLRHFRQCCSGLTRWTADWNTKPGAHTSDNARIGPAFVFQSRSTSFFASSHLPPDQTAYKSLAIPQPSPPSPPP